MAPISLKRGKIDVLGSELIQEILEIKESDTNHKLALEYAMSNFRFHRFLDVNPLDVTRALTGLVSKFRVNSQDKKANYLEDLVDKFVNQPLLEDQKEERTQTDAHYALLSLLLNLSNNPLNSNFSPRDEKKEVQGLNQFDWKKYLLGDEDVVEVGIPCDYSIERELDDSDEELWTLSDAEDATTEDEDSEHIYAEIAEFARKEEIEMQEESTVEDYEWLQSNVIHNYWNSKEKFKIYAFDYKRNAQHTCNNWVLYSRSSSKQYTQDQLELLTEKQLVRETLWMLQGFEKLHIYKEVDGELTTADDLVVTHLTKDTLKNLLMSFTNIGNQILTLRHFSQDITNIENNEYSKSFRAFGYMIYQFLKKMNLVFSLVERTVIDEVEPVTLAVIHERLCEEFEKINCVFKLYNQAVVEGFKTFSTVTERVVYFFNIFYNALCTYDSLGNAGIKELSVLLPMFLGTFEPYLQDLENWMTMGQLPYYDDEEFMIYKPQDLEKGSSNYWSQTFKIKEIKDMKLVPSILGKIQKQILLSGKSLGLLAEFGKHSQNIIAKSSLFNEFKENLKQHLMKSNERFLKGSKLPIGEYVVDGIKPPVENSKMDPLIIENFNKMFLDRFNIVQDNKKKDKSTEREEDEENWFELLKNGSCRPPIKLLFEQSLSPVIHGRYDKACLLLLELFKNEMMLFRHLDIMKSFFLMQDGGTMYDFHSEVFEKIKRKEFYSIPFLNIVLQDAISHSQYPDLMGSLVIQESTPTIHSNSTILDGLALYYKVPWPVTIILNNDTQKRYNEIFTFLLKIKRAIWVLEQLRFYELLEGSSSHYDSRENIDEDEENKNESKKTEKQRILEILPDPSMQRLRTRMLIIRMKLLHVIRSFHFYLMTRIKTTTSTDFDGKLRQASDLDDFIEIHQMFLNNLKQRCFLHEKIGRSREALIRIINLALDFEEMWCAGINKIDLNKLNNLEKDFNRCTSFLHSFFSSLAKRGSYPHFEFLANSLKTETKGHQAVFRR